MTPIDLDHLRTWIGKSRADEDVIAAHHARLMAATVDHPHPERIDYDQDYCRTVEGYANLVVHGPLTATMLAAFAEEASGRTLREFSYRGLRPALLGDALTLSASLEGDHASLAARLGDGAICMQADAAFADPASGQGA